MSFRDEQILDQKLVNRWLTMVSRWADWGGGAIRGPACEKFRRGLIRMAKQEVLGLQQMRGEDAWISLALHALEVDRPELVREAGTHLGSDGSPR